MERKTELLNLGKFKAIWGGGGLAIIFGTGGQWEFDFINQYHIRTCAHTVLLIPHTLSYLSFCRVWIRVEPDQTILQIFNISCG